MPSSDTSPENLQRLARKHIARYEPMLREAERGNPAFLAGELRCLLRCWREVERTPAMDLLSPEAQVEISDAIEAGE